MRTLIKIFFLTWILTLSLNAQEDTRFKPYGQDADILNNRNLRYSLFTKGEYGISDKVTLRGHPLWIFIAPSVDVKWQWKRSDKQSVAFIHGISSPTPVMNIFAMEGTSGLISPEFDIPFMLSLKNGMISTWHLQNTHRLTGEFGIEFALFNKQLNPGSSIDLPVISPRNAVYYKNFGMDLAIAAEGSIIGKFDYYSKIQGFFFPSNTKRYETEYGQTGSYFGEGTAMFFWNTSKKCKLGLGSKLTFGSYPFGNQWHLLPFIDFVRYSW